MFLTAKAIENEQIAQVLTTQVADKGRLSKLYQPRLQRDKTLQALMTKEIEKDQAIQTLSAQAAEREQAMQALSAQAAEISNSKAWKIALFIRRIRVLLAPPNTRRARILRSLYELFIAPIINIKRS